MILQLHLCFEICLNIWSQSWSINHKTNTRWSLEWRQQWQVWFYFLNGLFKSSEPGGFHAHMKIRVQLHLNVNTALICAVIASISAIKGLAKYFLQMFEHTWLDLIRSTLGCHKWFCFSVCISVIEGCCGVLQGCQMLDEIAASIPEYMKHYDWQDLWQGQFTNTHTHLCIFSPRTIPEPFLLCGTAHYMKGNTTMLR